MRDYLLERGWPEAADQQPAYPSTSGIHKSCIHGALRTTSQRLSRAESLSPATGDCLCNPGEWGCGFYAFLSFLSFL